MRLPGPRPEDGAADLAGARHHDRRRRCRRPPRREQLRGHAGHRRRAPRRRSRRRSRSRAPPRARSARCSGRRCRSCARSSRCCASIRRRWRSRSPARRGACARPSATSTSSRPRPTRRRSSTTSARCRWVVEVAAKGHDEGDGRLARRPALRPARRAAGELRQPAAALHRLEEPQRRAARGRGAPRLLGLRVLGHRGRDGRGAPLRDRGGGLRASSATTGSRRSCARTAASSPRRATGELPTLVELARPARRPAHAHDLVGRQGLARGHGRRGAARAATRTTRSATTRSACAASCCAQQAEADRRAERARRAVPDPQGDRGEHPARRRRSTSPTRTSRRSTGWSRRCTRASTTTRPSACSRRWRARTSTASAT